MTCVQVEHKLMILSVLEHYLTGEDRAAEAPIETEKNSERKVDSPVCRVQTGEFVIISQNPMLNLKAHTAHFHKI